ncbi:SUR7/PalI family-domain-containing protein [Naematelia encephala]|uniref:SUR7/PalI family-domain-containing protein n=1 Tax=Naematelia encephala TaxID=71784 RepID=A0A1Y2AL85_9TREE|nr:SUR7/PalI family-domain-containing protein [Naematelia encephala]
MAIGPIHCGTFLLFAATILLLVATISAPVVDKIAFLDINSGAETTSFGVFGYCLRPSSGADQCTGSHVGYDITTVTGTITSHSWVNKSIHGLTKALILHPIACGLSFIAFIVALLSSQIGFLFASFLAFLAFLVSLASMAIDFALFTIVRNHINDNTTATASFSTAIWLVLAATVVLFFSVFIVCFSCVTGRRHERDNHSRGGIGNNNATGGYYGNGGYTGDQVMMDEPVGKRHFWNRNKAVY